MSCKRNAFHMLYNIDQKRAIRYLLSVIDQVPGFDEHLQLAIVELIHKECLSDSVEKVTN
jgi:coatomer subunit beta